MATDRARRRPRSLPGLRARVSKPERFRELYEANFEGAVEVAPPMHKTSHILLNAACPPPTWMLRPPDTPPPPPPPTPPSMVTLTPSDEGDGGAGVDVMSMLQQQCQPPPTKRRRIDMPVPVCRDFLVLVAAENPTLTVAELAVALSPEVPCPRNIARAIAIHWLNECAVCEMDAAVPPQPPPQPPPPLVPACQERPWWVDD